MKKFYVYMATNYKKTVLYIGFTSNLQDRMAIHKAEVMSGFSAKYHATRLIYFEEYSAAVEAIAREKQLKRWSRKKKDWLIGQVNPTWDELLY